MCMQNLMKLHHFRFIKDEYLQRAITLKELVPGPYFSIIDINVFAKFYEIPSLPFQDIEKPKCRGRMDGQCENSIPPPPPPPQTVCRGV